jgi:hypothetical protein
VPYTHPKQDVWYYAILVARTCINLCLVSLHLPSSSRSSDPPSHNLLPHLPSRAQLILPRASPLHLPSAPNSFTQKVSLQTPNTQTQANPIRCPPSTEIAENNLVAEAHGFAVAPPVTANAVILTRMLAKKCVITLVPRGATISFVSLCPPSNKFVLSPPFIEADAC